MSTSPKVEPYTSHPRATRELRPDIDKSTSLAPTQSSITTPPEQMHRAREESKPQDWGPYWSERHRWRLLGSMHELFLNLKRRASFSILSERRIVQPEEMRCEYSFQAWGYNYEMLLTLRMDGVAVFFSSQKQGCHPIWLKFPVIDPYWGESYSWKIADELHFPTATVNNNDCKMWFFYLISGFRDSLKPTHPKND